MTSTDEPIAEQAGPAEDTDSSAPESHVGVSRSVARVLGRAARWAVDEAETLGGSAKQVMAVGGRVTTWVTGSPHEDAASTQELLTELKAMLSEKSGEELDSLEHDAKFWTLLSRLQKNQRRWPWGRAKTSAEAAEPSADGGLLKADNGGDSGAESGYETAKNDPSGPAQKDAAEAQASAEESPSPLDAAMAEQVAQGEGEPAADPDDEKKDEDAPKGKKGK